jgi:hypothetical protein
MAIQLTVFTKSSGILTKMIALAPDGSISSDASACVMARGTATRIEIDTVRELADLIENLPPNRAIALGALRSGLPDAVEVISKDRLARRRLNGAAVSSNIIARTGSEIVFQKGQPAFALLDHDRKGMPMSVSAELKRLGGFWHAMIAILPQLETAARVTRLSTSAGLYRLDTGERFPDFGGLHVYLEVRDGDDIDRFLTTVHERAWLAGLGWIMVSKSGALLERSIVDRMVGAPERLVFEAEPVLVKPLAQDRESRRPTAVDGEALDTVAACPPLTAVERAEFDKLLAKERQRLAPEAAKARSAFIAEQAEDLAKRTGKTEQEARWIIERQCEGVLHPDVILPFDDPALAGCTVGGVLDDPDRFVGETLADPLEGVAYGRCKAVMWSAGSLPWIHSFAHGRTIYELKFDAASIRVRLERAAKNDVVKQFVRLTVNADVDASEIEELRNFAAKLSGITKTSLKSIFKEEQQKQIERHAKAARRHRLAEDRDPRPEIEVPSADEPWLPQMHVLNDVIGKVSAAQPPARDIDAYVARARKLTVPNLHAFSTKPISREQTMTRLPPPEQWVLHRMSEIEVAEIIEEHINFVDKDGRSVHLPMDFVRHYMRRGDRALPTVVAIASAPVVLADGGLLAPDGLDRDRGIIFIVQRELRAAVPDPEHCDDVSVRAAIQFLCDEWLCDVATDFVGKCTIIAAALTIIERSLLPDRPVFFITAGRRGGGKTTTLTMLIMALTGIWPAAAAWSSNEESGERRCSAIFYAA